ncbi:MAG: CAP domain-containing protein [Myxococcota bacterium]
MVVSMAVVGCGVIEDGDVLDPNTNTFGVVEIPEGPYCDRVSEWDSQWAGFEDEVLRLVNIERGVGGVCAGGGEQRSFPASAPLSNNGFLRCAARNHSLDMAANRFFSHNHPETNEQPSDRINRTGYAWSRVGENIAVGQNGPAAVVDAWMNSFGHCTNILEPSYVEIGVGFYDSGAPHSTSPATIPGRYWTQNFGTPR